MRLSAKQLGDLGEAHAATLLRERGFAVDQLPVNFPTYDLEVTGKGRHFFVSVKVSREKQHVSIGSRSSVLRLSEGNYVFAFMPNGVPELTALSPAQYRLLILPAERVRDDSLRVHDAYWAVKGGDTGYRVMVKGYGSHHREMWPQWLRHTDAWQQLEPGTE
jgi:hypothetical protein